MNTSETDFRIVGNLERPHVASGSCTVRGVAGLIFVLVGVGLITVHRLTLDADELAMVNATQPPQAATGADAPTPYFPAQYVNQASAIQPHIEAF